ncbi:SLOG domain-containing protein [Archangium violaceum]|uniref:SLOG domain-containing protein n=1 Tax=Archangium violaceum TaxID=83451 RepID=UPI0036D80A68
MAARPLGPVFLSASIPSPDRDPAYMRTANLVAIREAVSALTLVVVPSARLVFGGHPAISPLVHLAAEQLGFADNVFIYQSQFYRSVIPPSSLQFRHLLWTPAGADSDSSLLRMREQMILSEPFHAGVFIGGMEGVEAEFQLFQRHHPHALLLAVASTGAAARVLFDQQPGSSKDAGLENDVAYAALFRRLLTGSAGPGSSPVSPASTP